MKEPILITGCARSGTSVVAGIIHKCGAFGGNMSGPTRHNQKGMFENARIRNDIVKPFFRSLGVDPMGQYPLPPINNLPIPNWWKDRVERVIGKEGYKDGAWMYKGAKMCLFWPVWDNAFPSAKWVIVRRKTSDIINSCIKTGFMRAFKLERNQRLVEVNNEHDGWLWWVHQHEERFVEMMQNVQFREIWPERMVDEDFTQIQEIIEWLGLQWTDEIYSFVEKKLWKSKQLKYGNINHR